MKILVVLVGHTPEKLKRLKHLYFDNKPTEKHNVVIIYNGSQVYHGADLYVPNDKRGRDVKMYYKAVKKYKADFYFFMNDDIVYIKDNNWLETAIKMKTEVVGVQANLSSIISTDVIKRIAKRVPSKWIRWGDKAQFIRTSAFGCTKDYFLRIWKASNGSAQNFEKKTLKLAESWGLFTDPFYIFDKNLKPYYKYFKENRK